MAAEPALANSNVNPGKSLERYQRKLEEERKDNDDPNDPLFTVQDLKDDPEPRKMVVRTMAKELLAAGADIEAENGEGGTPLICAIYSGNLDLAFFLIRSGANVNARTGIGQHGFGRESPLHLAACFSDAGLVAALLMKGADVNATTSGGATPLYHAVCDSESLACTKLLVEAGAKIDKRELLIEDYEGYDELDGGEFMLILDYLNKREENLDRRKEAEKAEGEPQPR